MHSLTHDGAGGWRAPLHDGIELQCRPGHRQMKERSHPIPAPGGCKISTSSSPVARVGVRLELYFRRLDMQSCR